MVTNSFKLLMVLACSLGILAGCASTSDEDMANDGMDDANANANAQNTAPVTPAPVEQAPVIDTVFYFDFDQSVLKPESRAALTAHAAQLKNNSVSVRLEGHSDERGTREYNMALGERRANAVADFLVLQGVSRSRIETISYGEERPARMGDSESSWAMNRRVELK